MNIDLKLNSRLEGVIQIPASKSYSQRALAAALLHEGTSILTGLGLSTDEQAALEIIQALGANVKQDRGQTIIYANGKINASSSIYCNESGLAARLFIPIAALASKAIIISGAASLCNRPMDFYDTVLRELSVQLSTTNSRLPFIIKGPIKPKSLKVSGSQSSQFISGLLFALSHTTCPKHLTISVEHLVSKPYIDLTIDVLRHWGKHIEHKEYQEFFIRAHHLKKQHIHYTIEADWSSAAFWIAAAAISGNLMLKGLNKESKQADRNILAVLKQVGAQVEWIDGQLLVAHRQLNAFDIDLNDSPDLFPILSVLAACCHGQSRLASVHRLWHKESNRATEIVSLLQQLGVAISIANDVMIIEGVSQFKPINYRCPNDHRMAMAAALSGLRANGTCLIWGAECVRKSYPDFWQQLASFGSVQELP